MKWLVVIPLLSALALAADIIVLDDESELAMRHCHPGDEAIIHVVPVPLTPNRVVGSFSTTNAALRLEDLSMVPHGTNRFSIQTICQGVTNTATNIIVFLKHPLPLTIVAVRSRMPPRPILPPSPPGMVARVEMPLPLPSNIPPGDTYGEFQKRLKDAREKGRRRSQ